MYLIAVFNFRCHICLLNLYTNRSEKLTISKDAKQFAKILLHHVNTLTKKQIVSLTFVASFTQ